MHGRLVAWLTALHTVLLPQFGLGRLTHLVFLTPKLCQHAATQQSRQKELRHEQRIEIQNPNVGSNQTFNQSPVIISDCVQLPLGFVAVSMACCVRPFGHSISNVWSPTSAEKLASRDTSPMVLLSPLSRTRSPEAIGSLVCCV